MPLFNFRNDKDLNKKPQHSEWKQGIGQDFFQMSISRGLRDLFKTTSLALQNNKIFNGAQKSMLFLPKLLDYIKNRQSPILQFLVYANREYN